MSASPMRLQASWGQGPMPVLPALCMQHPHNQQAVGTEEIFVGRVNE